MSTRKQTGNALQAVLNRHSAGSAAETGPPPEQRTKATVSSKRKFSRPSREGMRLIAGHFPPAVAKQLKILAAEEETSVQELLGEALDLLFIKKGRGAIHKL